MSNPRPFIKYVGGKTQLLPTLLARVPVTRVYHEPFVGGGALFFALRPKTAYLSDANARLIRTYRAVRNDIERVIELLKEHAQAHSLDHFLATRALDIDVRDDAEVAAWLIYLNKTGFNGLYRVNKSGKFNVPFGKYTNPKICDEENLRACSAALQYAVIRREDFRISLVWPLAGDFVYLDPPYVPLSKTSSFTSYTADKFTAKDQMDLAMMAKDVKDRGVHVLISNSSAPEVIESLYPSFEAEVVTARRSINSKGDKRGPIQEYLLR